MASFIFPGQLNESELRRFVLAALGVLVFMILFFLEGKPYDLSTAMFFAFGLASIVRGKWSSYFALFAFASVNRETSFLLAMVFGVYQFGRVGWKGWLLPFAYQAYLFLAIRVCLLTIFAANPGVTMMIRPLENLRDFVSSPIAAIVHWFGFAIVIRICLRRWKFAPETVKVAFAVMMPALMVMYLVLGWAFEVRVFAEVFPVVWWLMWNERGMRCEGGEKRLNIKQHVAVES